MLTGLSRLAVLEAFQAVLERLYCKYHCIVPTETARQFYQTILTGSSADYWALCDQITFEGLDSKEQQSQIHRALMAVVFPERVSTKREFDREPITAKQLAEFGHDALLWIYDMPAASEQFGLSCL